MRKPKTSTPLERPSDPSDTAPKRDHHGFRGVPPPAQFDLDELAPSALLSERDIAAVLRIAVVTIQTWRRRQHPLKWHIVGGGRVRYFVRDFREFLASGGNLGQPRKSGIVPKRYAPPRPRGRPRKPPAQPRAEAATSEAAE